MTPRKPKVTNYIPGYKGYVPGLMVENDAPFVGRPTYKALVEAAMATSDSRISEHSDQKKTSAKPRFSSNTHETTNQANDRQV